MFLKCIDEKRALSLVVCVAMFAGCAEGTSTPNTKKQDDTQQTNTQPQTQTDDQSNTDEQNNTDSESDTSSQTVTSYSYNIVDTNQVKCFDANGIQVSCTSKGQDGSYIKNAPSYTSNGDGTVTDNVTHLMWQQTTDTNGDNVIDVNDKMEQPAAAAYCQSLALGGYTDWRLPDIKTMYSLIEFSGQDVSSYSGTDTSGLKPFIDNGVFGMGYGDTSAGERIIDAQWATTSYYVSTTMNGNTTMFGVNFADGRIKGYPANLGKLFYVQCVRGNEDYGKNNFVDNSDDTITDKATELMWEKNDNATGVSWDDAIGYCEDLTLANHSDWRLPNAKELQSIVDYTRSPDTTNSAAIDPLFNATQITNEANQADYGFYWSSTTHENTENGKWAAYVSFGRALGYMNGSWMDVHGAGAQRSDPKDVADLDTSDPSYQLINGSISHGPQGDVVRGLNFARCVRDAQ